MKIRIKLRVRVTPNLRRLPFRGWIDKHPFSFVIPDLHRHVETASASFLIAVGLYHVPMAALIVPTSFEIGLPPRFISISPIVKKNDYRQRECLSSGGFRRA